MLDKMNQIELARAAAKASVNPSGTYSFNGENMNAEALNKAFINELNELGRDRHSFDENKNQIYQLLEVALTEVVPANILSMYGQFADVKTYPQGTKPVFKVNISEASKKRAKQFVTKVGLAGRYEVFKLDGYSFEVSTSAFGGAARVEWEEILDGRFSMNDYYSLVLEGLNEAIYKEIAKALTALVGNLPATNKKTNNTFVETDMDKLLATADVYGKATIYCTFEFAATMLPMTSNATNWNAFSNEMKNQIWNNGAFTTYKGHNVVILPQTFEDETNKMKVIDPSIAYIIPTGADKPIKVAFEGSAQVKSFENRDWSTEIQTYQKVGVASYIVNPGICAYINSSLVKNN